jgi:hypothetical protein
VSENLKRVQMLIRPEQQRSLNEIAVRQGKSVAEVTRKAIDLGLAVLVSQDEFIKRDQALKQAEELRKAMRKRRGRPLDIDVVADLRELREAHDDFVSCSG